jgi:hypothetical protein
MSRIRDPPYFLCEEIFFCLALSQAQVCQLNIEACASCGEKHGYHTKAACENKPEPKKQTKTQTDM